MRRHVTIRPRADQDIDEHLNFLAGESGIDTALRFFDAVQDACERLLKMPEMGAPREDLTSTLPLLRMWPISAFPKYLIFYQPVHSGIDVVRVIYGTRDIPTLFEEEP